MNYVFEEVRNVSPGQIFFTNGKRYKLLKKTTTAIQAVRWYWFDVLFERLFKKEENG